LFDFLRCAERSGTAYFSRNMQRLERCDVTSEVLSLPREDQEVAERSAFGIHLGPDVTRNLVSLCLWHVSLLYRGWNCQREDA
jgi:hypothetical protein